MKVEVYFDVVCPWCYIGERRFAEALESMGAAADDIEVAYRPYQLDPSAPSEAVPIEAYLERRFGAVSTSMQQRVSAAAADAGIRIDWSKAQMANTMSAHRLVRLAQQEYAPDVERALVGALFRAHFTDGGNVADHAELVELARSVGIDGSRAAEWLETGGGEVEVRSAIEYAQAIGVQSVPTFVFDGRYAVAGAQPAETFVHAIEDVRNRSESVGAATGEV